VISNRCPAIEVPRLRAMGVDVGPVGWQVTVVGAIPFEGMDGVCLSFLRNGAIVCKTSITPSVQ
jgi:hypothetical protein